MTEEIILTGWKSICAACGIKSKITMKKKVRKYHIPIKRLDGRPCIPKDLLIEYFTRLKN